MIIKYFFKTINFFLILIFVLNSFVFAQNQTSEKKSEPVRRALLVGINEYKISDQNKSFGALASALNDVKAMENLLKSKNYNFQVKSLTDRDATRENILREFENYLVNQAKAGDISVFYFSGHGSQVINSLGGESDKMDETLVPYDVARPVKQRSDLKDIRDKEINALLNKAIKKGVIITSIIDSCHSGSIGRDDEELRRLEPAKIDIKEKPSEDQLLKAADKGALVISAAQDFQRATSGDYSHLDHADFKNGTLGHLTANLLLSLYRTPADLISAEDLFKQMAARMRADALEQQPEIDAMPERKRKTLFGTELNSEITRAPIAIENGKPFLQAGLADGVSTGSEFARVEVSSDKETEPRIRIRVTNAGLNKSEFEIITTPTTGEKPQSGDFFKQQTWGASTEPYLTVWMPSSNLTAEQIKQIARELNKLRENKQIEIVQTPNLNAPTHILFVDETGNKPEWKMSFPQGKTEKLAAAPTAQSLQSLLDSHKTTDKIKLFANLPPPAELTKKLKFGGGGNKRSPISSVRARTGAIYQLVGRAKTVGETVELEYAWMLPTAFDEAAAGNPQKQAHRQPSLPPMTDWVNVAAKDADKKLSNLALRLAKIRGWLKLSSPSESTRRYPYRLEFRSVEGKKVNETDSLIEGTDYRLFLTADAKDLENNIGNIASRFFIYVITIDKNGNSVVLHPTGSNSPRIIDGLKPPTEIDITGEDRIYICETKTDKDCELGIENYVLLLTDTPFPNKDLLEFEGVRSEEQLRREKSTRSGSLPLESLLLDIGVENSSRSGLSTPDNWFVQQLTFESRKRE